MKEYDLIVIGAGAAGMSAALGAYEKDLRKILIIDRDEEYGGILQQCIHNGFGLHTFNKELSGPSFATECYRQIKDNPCIEFAYNTVVIATSANHEVKIQSKKGYETIRGKAIAICAGSKERSAGAISLKGARTQGVYTAGCAQKYANIKGFMVGKKVFILGSGDIGLIMARRMTLEGAKVIGVAEICPYSNGLARNVKQCLEDFDIPLYLSHTVVSVHGVPRLKSITLAEVDEKRQVIKGSEREIECDCLLLSVGLLPDVGLLDEMGAKLDRFSKGPVVNDQYQTSIPGYFACGNALHVHDLVDYVAMEAKKCGENIADYVLNHNERPLSIKTKASRGIGYVVPHYLAGGRDAEISFRVSNIYHDVSLKLSSGSYEKVIRKSALLPSEMVKLNLKKEDIEKFADELVLEVVE